VSSSAFNARLRQAVAGDIPAIQRIRHSVRENRLRPSVIISDEQVREVLENAGRGWVVEVAEGQVVGFSIGNAETGNIWALFVDPDHERRGYGRQLLDTLVAWLWSQGLERLWLTTGRGTRAQGFYESAGWQLAGTTAGGELRFELARASVDPSP
jgi:GNAT superfamily N-acetyltransferase